MNKLVRARHHRAQPDACCSAASTTAPETMTLLVQAPRPRQRAPVLRLRARPGEGRRGSAHHAARPALDIEKHVRGSTAGFNTPTFVVDAPGGGGKRDAHSYEYYDRETGISVYTAPAVQAGRALLLLRSDRPAAARGAGALGRSGRARSDDRRGAGGGPGAPHLEDRHERGCTELRQQGRLRRPQARHVRAPSTRRWRASTRRAAGTSATRRPGSAPASGGAKGDALAEAAAAGCTPQPSTVRADPRRPATTSTFSASGARPSLVELREAALDAGASEALRAAIAEGPVDRGLPARALFDVGPVRGRSGGPLTAALDPDHGTIASRRGAARGRLRAGAAARGCSSWSAVLAELDIRHLDFGEIVEPPAGFDPGDYAAEYGGLPGVANYLFYPQPPSAIATTTLT